MKSTATSYGSTARFLHWASALLILVLLVTGFRSGFSEDAETKAAALRVHVPVALLVLGLTVWRLVWWWRFDTRPAPVEGVPAWQEAAGRWTHRALYVLILLLLASGITMSAMSGLPLALFGDAPLPELSELPPRAGHGIGARLIAAAVLLHLLAALFHHVVLGDRTLSRMLRGGG